MVLSQSRIAETVQTFYSAADRTSEGAMAGHAYKRSVDDLDSSFTRELVSFSPLSGLFTDLNKDGPYRTTISEPLGKMCSHLPVVNEHITKRNKKV